MQKGFLREPHPVLAGMFTAVAVLMWAAVFALTLIALANGDVEPISKLSPESGDALVLVLLILTTAAWLLTPRPAGEWGGIFAFLRMIVLVIAFVGTMSFVFSWGPRPVPEQVAVANVISVLVSAICAIGLPVAINLIHPRVQRRNSPPNREV